MSCSFSASIREPLILGGSRCRCTTRLIGIGRERNTRKAARQVDICDSAFLCGSVVLVSRADRLGTAFWAAATVLLSRPGPVLWAVFPKGRGKKITQSPSASDTAPWCMPSQSFRVNLHGGWARGLEIRDAKITKKKPESQSQKARQSDSQRQPRHRTPVSPDFFSPPFTAPLPLAVGVGRNLATPQTAAALIMVVWRAVRALCMSISSFGPAALGTSRGGKLSCAAAGGPLSLCQHTERISHAGAFGSKAGARARETAARHGLPWACPKTPRLRTTRRDIRTEQTGLYPTYRRGWTGSQDEKRCQCSPSMSLP